MWGPADLDSRAVDSLDAAAERGILIEPGRVHFAAHDAPRNFFRLGFSSIPEERIEPGIELLAEVVREQMKAVAAE